VSHEALLEPKVFLLLDVCILVNILHYPKISLNYLTTPTISTETAR
jgi:hypothetical protein